ncbi:MAG: ferrous iron transport protein B [Peptococcaceae bacterium]|nr:ferrous iron transport protein B [Peptococcaceae bacterium]
MGLNRQSVGLNAGDTDFLVKKTCASDKVIALAGNPNVGKSTLFNELTGLRQHTGNWPGKTVTVAQGRCSHKQKDYVIVDLPGCYSLLTRSAEEEAARDFICFGGADAVVVVCDAACMERGLNLVLQTLEITDRVIVCVNLMDEAKKKNININLTALSAKLGVPVIGTTARNREGLDTLMDTVGLLSGNLVTSNADDSEATDDSRRPYKIDYPDYIESALSALEPFAELLCKDPQSCSYGRMSSRWVALMLLQNRFSSDQEFTDDIVCSIVKAAESLCLDAFMITDTHNNPSNLLRPLNSRIDDLLLGNRTAFPIMILALLGIFWLTIVGANYPSQVISTFLFWLEDRLFFFLQWIHAPVVLSDMLVLGVYRVLAWVISVMLPPMAIFFPLFTLLEDAGFLPRIAFNLDKWFKKCSACGKQALTMCMGFGCNAAGVIGCRIIDSPRERLIAILTNNFVPCNGRFPTLIAIASMFFIGVIAGSGEMGASGIGALRNSLLSAVLLTGMIVLGISMTFLASKLLSKTVLKGAPSSFTLELPPYRKPQLGKVLVRSVFDRTLFVLGRAVCVAAPAGLIIWLLANMTIENTSLLIICSNFLDPFARLLGMDGVILLAFILGFPANEIVIPIMIMAYMAQGNIMDLDNLSVLKQLLVDNGWTWTTAVCVMLFSLMHWPCSTTCLTIKKETQSLKWTLVSIVLPTGMGMVICLIFATLAKSLTG